MDIDGSYYCSKCMQTVDNDSLICPHCGYEPSNSATDSQHLAEGTFLKDRYLIGAVIGAGGFGVTYAAWDENLSVPVAIKEYFPIKYAHRNTEESDAIVAHDESRGLFALGLDRFRREAQVLAQFQNVPGIVNINECFDENETAYIAMEFVHGVPLDAYVREHHPSPKKLLEIMLPAINALEIIHRQGINHRDIKPDNLLVQADGSIKLIDFGSAREVEHVTNLIVVSDGYAPLEQYDLKQPQGPWVDVYGISATIYHMLTGVMPEASISRAKNDTLKAPSKLGVKLKKYQEKALMAGLAVDPQKRIQSIAEFRALLYNMPLPEEVRRRKAFVRRFITTAVLTVLLLAAVVVNFACGFPLGEGLLYSLYPDGWHVVGSYEQRSEITIPETKLSIPVSAIADSAFRDNQTVETVIIPGSVSSIGQYSFANCANLETAKIEDGVTTIGMGAFHSSGILGYISLPQTITTIGEYAFYNCDNLEAIFSNLDRELRIGDYAFSDCDQLTWLDFSYAAVVHIGNNAFRYCSKLREADLPFALEYIGDHAFEDCIKLEKFDLRLLVEEVPIIATYIGEYAFHNCESMTHFEFPRNVVHIGAGAFAYCCSLTNMMLPHDVTSIEDSTFEGCSSLTSISIPDDVISIGYATFEGCSSLTSITLPDDLTSIGAAAFKRCSSLVSITIPNGISRIESESFYGCSSLTHISIPDGLHYIGYGSFGECGSLASILIPDSVITIDSLALFDCSSLTSIIIPDGVTSIGAGAFSGCSSLTKITLPNGITLIERWAFSGCSSLVCINLPNTVTTIESDVFQGCSSLYSIFLPDSVTSIGNGVFSNCPSDLVITVDPYTYAAQFCQENNLNYVYTDELPET